MAGWQEGDHPSPGSINGFNQDASLVEKSIENINYQFSMVN
jgi:hypothetical protein